MAGWLVAWGLYECMLIYFSAVWIPPHSFVTTAATRWGGGCVRMAHFQNIAK